MNLNDLYQIEQRLVEECRGDWRKLLYSGLLKIKTKTQGIQPFIPNAMQCIVIDRIWELEQAGKQVRLLIPKARQHGITTLIMTIIFVKTLLHAHITAIVMAHLENVATEIFDKAQLMYENIPDFLKNLNKKVKSNAKELRYQNNSKIAIKSAESKRQRGTTGQILLCSEVAFYSDCETLMTGLLQQIPDGEGTMIVMESTGNGVGGYFYDMVIKAEAGENEYEVIFLPWWQNPEYCL